METWRDNLAEAASEVDDDVLTKYLEGEPLTEEDYSKILSAALKQNLIVPVLCGSAFKNIGIANLLDFIVTDVPRPVALPDKQPGI